MVSEMYTSKRSAYSCVLSHHNWTSCIASSFIGLFDDILGSPQKAICGQIRTTLDVQVICDHLVIIIYAENQDNRLECLSQSQFICFIDSSAPQHLRIQQSQKDRSTRQRQSRLIPSDLNALYHCCVRSCAKVLISCLFRCAEQDLESLSFTYFVSLRKAGEASHRCNMITRLQKPSRYESSARPKNALSDSSLSTSID